MRNRRRGGVLPRAHLTLRALSWVLRVEWRRRRQSLDQVVAWLESVRQRDERSVSTQSILAAVRRVYSCLPFEPSCLKESLAALGLLRSLGYPARLMIGVKPAPGLVDAHAWVEVDGAPLDPRSSTYTRLRRAGAGRDEPIG